MTLKEKLFYLLSVSIECGINPRAFMWRVIMRGHSGTYYMYLAELRRRKPFDQEKLKLVHQSFEEVFKAARAIWGSRWKGDWYMVIFDIPENYHKFRNQFRRKLIQFGFGPLQESIMISPVDRFHLVQESVHYDLMSPFIIYLRVKDVYGFNREELIARCWDLGVVRREYEDFLNEYGQRVQGFLDSSGSWPDQERRATSKWLLLVIQEELSELLKRYPPLPRQLLKKQLPFDRLVKDYLNWHRKLSRI